jgi:hypothetical protein
MGKTMVAYPISSWSMYEKTIKEMGEHKVVLPLDSFLVEAGFTTEGSRLTPDGQRYFESRFIRQDAVKADEIRQSLLLDYPPISAICQLLYGVPNAGRNHAETVLRSQGMGAGLNDRVLGTLLAIMKAAGMIYYAHGKIKVIVAPNRSEVVPDSVFIARETPYGNKIWLRRVLEECEGFIYWLDKHFMSRGFEALWEAADGNRISDIKVLSLGLDAHLHRRSFQEYKDLRSELSSRGIALEWRVIDHKLIRDTHDRWIVGKSSARNVPDVSTIFSGNHSELNRSDQAEKLKEIFDGYWTQALPASL